MKFGLLYEHQLPRPWNEENSDHRLLKNAIEQVELADRLGFDYIWENEHHFLEEYSHSSAPEVFLAFCARNTTQIRLGHAVVLSPPGYNHPARVAERIATLDLLSDGRVEFGTGESASRVELEGFGIDPEQKKAMWAEAVEQTANMMTMSPYPGYEGDVRIDRVANRDTGVGLDDVVVLLYPLARLWRIDEGKRQRSNTVSGGLVNRLAA